MIYDKLLKSIEVSSDLVLGSNILLAALSMDGKIYNNHWFVIGKIQKNISSIPQPFYKINYGNKVFVESRDRSIMRPANETEAKILRFRTIVSPVRLENALKAAKGFAEWNDGFSDLTADYAFQSSAAIRMEAK